MLRLFHGQLEHGVEHRLVSNFGEVAEKPHPQLLDGAFRGLPRSGEGHLHPGLSSLWGHLGGIWTNEDYLKPKI